MGRTATGLVLVLVVLGACTNDGSDIGEAHRRRAISVQERRDVPAPSLTSPDGSTPDPKTWHEMWRSTPGTPQDRCIEVDARSDVRSGDFIVGNFAAFIGAWDGTYETSKLYYIPAHPTEGQPLEVMAELLDETTPQRAAYTFDGYAWTIPGAIPFYATGTALPVRGRWRLTATAGENSGCFELAL
jgi:hypothetical protein